MAAYGHVPEMGLTRNDHLISNDVALADALNLLTEIRDLLRRAESDRRREYDERKE